MSNQNILMKLLIILPIVTVIDGNELNTIPEYEGLFKRKTMNLRRRLFNNKIEKQKSRLLDELTNNTIYVDGVPHVDIDRSGMMRDRIDEIENGFKLMLGMKGVKYTFRRGFHWRTWRVIDEGGTGTIVCYKCKGAVISNCNYCMNGGYWEIEEKPPPCPYEILSMPNDNQLCAIHFTQYNNIQTPCPTLINLNDLLSVCDNPIETEWRISPKYDNHQSSQINSTLTAVCSGGAGCTITTLYTVSPDSILFKIINSTNNIIYSRVMRSNHKNYACVDDCGVMDEKTKTVIKNDRPLIFNLLHPDVVSHKNKREYKVDADIKSRNPKDAKLFYKNLQSDGIRKIVWVVKNSNRPTTHPIKKTMCKKLIEAYTEDYSDSIDI